MLYVLKHNVFNYSQCSIIQFQLDQIMNIFNLVYILCSFWQLYINFQGGNTITKIWLEHYSLKICWVMLHIIWCHDYLHKCLVFVYFWCTKHIFVRTNHSRMLAVTDGLNPYLAPCSPLFLTFILFTIKLIVQLIILYF